MSKKNRNRIIIAAVLIIVIVLLLLTCGSCNNDKNKTDKKTARTETTITESTTNHKRNITVNVYLENSGSMDGYVNAGSNFVSILHRYVSNINSRSIVDSLSLYYINQKPILRGNKPELFSYDKVNRESFKNEGGDRGSTDIPEVFDNVLSRTNDSTVSILISDFIISPGRGMDATQYLNKQETHIKEIISKKTKELDLAIGIYRFTTDFKGRYYDPADRYAEIDQKRPFYVFVMGSKDMVLELDKDEVLADDLISNNLKNKHIFTKREDVDYIIVPNTGRFKLDKRDPSKRIEKARVDKRKGNFSFTLNMDLSNIPVEKNDINKDLFQLGNDNYQINNIREIGTHSTNHTHSISISSERVVPGWLDIKIVQRSAPWVDMYNDSVGKEVRQAKDVDDSTTFGIKQIINGIYLGYKDDGSDCFDEISIQITN